MVKSYRRTLQFTCRYSNYIVLNIQQTNYSKDIGALQVRSSKQCSTSVLINVGVTYTIEVNANNEFYQMLTLFWKLSYIMQEPVASSVGHPDIVVPPVKSTSHTAPW